MPMFGFHSIKLLHFLLFVNRLIRALFFFSLFLSIRSYAMHMNHQLFFLCVWPIMRWATNVAIDFQIGHINFSFMTVFCHQLVYYCFYYSNELLIIRTIWKMKVLNCIKWIWMFSLCLELQTIRCEWIVQNICFSAAISSIEN